MLKNLALAATIAATLTAGTPAAHAAVVHSSCAISTFSQATVTEPETFTGVAYGYAVFDDEGNHTLRCYVTVDGGENGASTPTQSGTGVVVAAGQITYTAAEDADVYVCTEIDGNPAECNSVNSPTPIPPPGLVCAVGTGCENSSALICVAALSGCNYDTAAQVCIAGSGCNNGGDGLVCIAGTGCNDGNVTVCIANDGCNNQSTSACVAVNGCNHPSLLSVLDPTICPLLASLAPGVGGVVDITAEGDTTILGIPFYDCPPYGNLS